MHILRMIGLTYFTEEARKQRMETKEASALARRHHNFFGFKPEPELLRNTEYQQEVLLRIGHLAIHARNEGREFKDLPYASDHDYNVCLAIYRNAVNVARYFYPEFKDMPLHWTKFPAFLEKWRNASNSKEFDEVISVFVKKPTKAVVKK